MREKGREGEKVWSSLPPSQSFWLTRHGEKKEKLGGGEHGATEEKEKDECGGGREEKRQSGKGLSFPSFVPTYYVSIIKSAPPGLRMGGSRRQKRGGEGRGTKSVGATSSTKKGRETSYRKNKASRLLEQMIAYLLLP